MKNKIKIISTVILFFPVLIHSEERLFLYSSNYATPARKEINLEYKIDYNRRACVKCGEKDANKINNLQQWMGLESGLTDNLSLSAFGIMTYGIEDNVIRTDSFYVGGKYRIGESGILPLDAGFTFGYLQETGGIPVLQAGGILSKESEEINFTSNILFEKAFEKGRDDIDVFITAGVSYEIAEWLRTGIEYAGQDLEDLWEEEEAEGGAQHIIGPVGAVRFNEKRIQMLFTPGLTFSPGGDGFIMRGMLSLEF